MELLFVLPTLFFIGLAIFSIFSSGYKVKTDKIDNTNKELKDLQKMQTYNFWRDFDK